MHNIIYDKSNKILSFRAVHITDVHIKDLDDASVFDARVPVFIESLNSKGIDYILNTGDTADSGVTTSDDAVEEFVAVMNFKAPMITARGNHDGSVTNTQLGMPVDNWYYQDINSKWRVIVLYSQGGGNYSLGATQTTWLTDTLTATPSTQYVCLMLHVPFCSVGAMMWHLRNANAWSFATDYMSDAKDILDLVKLYPNIKVCLSGHEHTIDRVEHEGIIYLNSGAVSANWWVDGTHAEKGYPAGYRLIDFYEDGTIKEKFLTY